MDDELALLKSTLQALERTSKGQSKCDLLGGKTLMEQMAILEETSAALPWSPQIEIWLKKMDQQSGLTNEYEACDNEPETMEIRSDVSFEDDEEMSSEPNLSVIEEIEREIEECGKSLDDELMSERTKHIESFMTTFQDELEQRQLEYRMRVPKETAVKKLMETNQMLEKLLLLEAQEMQQKYIEDCRTEKETTKAQLESGDKECKRLQQEILAKKRQHAQNQCMEEYKSLIRDLEDTWSSCVYMDSLRPEIKEGYQTVATALRSSWDEFKSKSNLEEQQIAFHLSKLNKIRVFLSHTLCPAVKEANAIGEQHAKLMQEEKDKMENERIEKERIERERIERERIERERLERERIEKLQREKLEQERLVKQLQSGSVTADMKTSSNVSSGAQNNAKSGTYSDPKKNEEHNKLQSKLVIPSSIVPLYLSLKKLISQVSAKNTLATSTDSSTKQYRFQLQKMVGLTVNGLSTNNGEVLIEKISRIKDLLKGKTLMIMGKAICTSKHADAPLYCSNLLALKIVKQGENEVSSNPAAAFPLAALTISLFSNFPDLGELIMAHFYDLWPILVPCYVKENSEMTKLDVLRWQGYKISSDGTAESEDDFLRRMCGVIRLYAAIISSPQLPIERSPHPHGPAHGWAWLARVMNTEPHPTMTAAALGSFLEVAGHVLMKCYGKQFQKLLYVLFKEYVPKLEKCTPPAQKGPFQRLVQFLDNSLKSGKFPEPKGFLHRTFWMTKNQGISYA